MRHVRQFYFPVLLILSLTVYLLQQFEMEIPKLANNYLNDFLCIPIVLKICQYAVRYIKSDATIKIPLLLQVIIALLFIFYFEGVLPQLNSRYTADVMDILAYSLGLSLFIMIEHQGGPKTQGMI
ncbi:hypothetical protein [Maribacter sp. 2210JD10-5]|uniref:hypothetical protein n=1 Tax=Maribacter sp. 2210JD10-5 TaxID=3386272 RepID=UPI0039BD38F7